MDAEDGAGVTEVESTTIREVLERHPVRTGILFGSHVTGRAHAGSDVDVAVEFDPSLSDEQRRKARLSVIVDLSKALGIDDVDVTDLDAIQPEVGTSALESGIVLVGDRERIERLNEEFSRRATERSHEERLQRFDELLSSIEEKA